MPSEEIQRLGPQGLTGWHTYHPLRLLMCLHCLWVPTLLVLSVTTSPGLFMRSTVLRQ